MSDQASSTADSSEFKYLPELDFLLQKIASSTNTQEESEYEVINVQSHQTNENDSKTDMRGMRSRQHLQYEKLRQFNDSNEFEQWWKHENNGKGWIFNTIYKKKTEDEVHVYRCSHKRCSCRVRVIFIANSCDVIVEHALIDHNHDDSTPIFKPDSIRTLSEDVKYKISVLEKTGMTATKIRRHLFKELQSTGAPLPTLKQIQNYIGRLRIKQPNTETTRLSQTPSTSNSDPSRNLDGTIKRKRGRPRLSEQRNQSPIQFPVFNLDPSMFDKEETSTGDAIEEEDQQDIQPTESTTMTEEEILQKLSEFLQASQTPASLLAKKLEEAPPMKRVRLSYHFEKSFPSIEDFHRWWAGKRSDHMIHNSTYKNNACEKIDIYRCSKRECRHRVRVVYNPTDKTVCVERTDMDHDISIHEAKASLSKNAKDIVVNLFDMGLKPKAIFTHFLQNKPVDGDELPTMTQIKNLVNRLKIKQRDTGNESNSDEFTWNLDQATSSLVNN